MSITPEILSPTGQSVRIVDGRVVLSDLGPAMGRTRAFMNAILGNSPSLQAVAIKVKVGTREGWSLGADGFRLLLSIIDGIVSRTAVGKEDLEKFMAWGRNHLLPAMADAVKGVATALPRRILIDLGDDLRYMRIQVEMTNGTKTVFNP